jgi:hypothetical protein
MEMIFWATDPLGHVLPANSTFPQFDVAESFPRYHYRIGNIQTTIYFVVKCFKVPRFDRYSLIFEVFSADSDQTVAP